MVGRLLPANSAYAAASYQLTPATGCFSEPLRIAAHLPGRGAGAARRVAEACDRLVPRDRSAVLEEGLLPELALLVSAGVDELLVLLVGDLVLVDEVVVERHRGKMIETRDPQVDFPSRHTDHLGRNAFLRVRAG